MKKLLLIWFTICIIALTGCKDSSKITDDTPAIKSISFVGIPNRDVQFDAGNARITVRMPAVLDGGLKPVVRLSDGAVLTGLLPDGTIDLSKFCYCGSNSAEDRYLRVSRQGATGTYELKLVTSGALKPQITNETTTFSLKSKVLKLSLPVENLYANHHVNQLTFENTKTGFSSVVSADGVCLNSCSGDAPNRMLFTLLSPIQSHFTPGTYRIALNGIQFPQTLVVTE